MQYYKANNVHFVVCGSSGAEKAGFYNRIKHVVHKDIQERWVGTTLNGDWVGMHDTRYNTKMKYLIGFCSVGISNKYFHIEFKGTVEGVTKTQKYKFETKRN
jgi:hypothetical protein